MGKDRYVLQSFLQDGFTFLLFTSILAGSSLLVRITQVLLVFAILAHILTLFRSSLTHFHTTGIYFTRPYPPLQTPKRSSKKVIPYSRFPNETRVMVCSAMVGSFLPGHNASRRGGLKCFSGVFALMEHGIGLGEFAGSLQQHEPLKILDVGGVKAYRVALVVGLDNEQVPAEHRLAQVVNGADLGLIHEQGFVVANDSEAFAVEAATVHADLMLRHGDQAAADGLVIALQALFDGARAVGFVLYVDQVAGDGAGLHGFGELVKGHFFGAEHGVLPPQMFTRRYGSG